MIPLKNSIIDITKLTTHQQFKLDSIISPAKEDVSFDVAEDHSADPIKNVDDIRRISDYLISANRYRDNMLFIVGINFGLRASDLRMLRFANLINDDFSFKDSFPVFEQKTRNTRKKKMNRYITINKAVREAVLLFLENTPSVSLSDYMFRSNSNRGSNKNEPISVRSIERIIKGFASDLGLGMHVSTHTLRKTFCYHQMLISNNDTRKLLLLQKMLNHSSPVQTLTYIGITSEEIEAAYRELNLGSRTSNGNDIIDNRIYEIAAYTA